MSDDSTDKLINSLYRERQSVLIKSHLLNGYYENENEIPEFLNTLIYMLYDDKNHISSTSPAAFSYMYNLCKMVSKILNNIQLECKFIRSIQEVSDFDSYRVILGMINNLNIKGQIKEVGIFPNHDKVILFVNRERNYKYLNDIKIINQRETEYHRFPIKEDFNEFK